MPKTNKFQILKFPGNLNSSWHCLHLASYELTAGVFLLKGSTPFRLQQRKQETQKGNMQVALYGLGNIIYKSRNLFLTQKRSKRCSAARSFYLYAIWEILTRHMEHTNMRYTAQYNKHTCIPLFKHPSICALPHCCFYFDLWRGFPCVGVYL